MEQRKRYFNTSGPNILSEHYTLLRQQLVAKGQDLVHRNSYFTIWAPRQTGKSTFFLLLKTALEKEGYRVVWTSMEKLTGAEFFGLLRNLTQKLKEAGVEAPTFETLDDFATFLESRQGEKMVFILDEIEGLNPEYFGQFLHTLRYLYHSRETHCLKSVILVGVSNIVGVVEDNASPFNIADNLNVPNFTNEETFGLLGQHETQTGQLFAPEVKAKIADVTANQPGLVNGFAQQLIERFEAMPLIGMEEYIRVENWYLRKAIDKNIGNIVSKAKRYRKFVETLLFTEASIPFDVEREEVRALFVNGVIDEDEEGNVTFKVPLYRKRLHNAFYPYTNGERGRLAQEMEADAYFLPDGRLNFEKWIAYYKAWVQLRSFKYFREKDENDNYLSIKEAALVYSFETFVAAFLQEAGGKSYLEPHTGLGRSDLILYVNGREYVVEFKVYDGKSAFAKGKAQLAYYCQKLGLTQGEYLVFVPKHIKVPDKVNEIPELIEGTGVTIRPWLVFYDEKTDF